MTGDQTRRASLLEAQRLGYPTSLALPSPDGRTVRRAIGEVGDRLLCLNAVLAVVHGLPAQKALDWLRSEGLDPSPEEDALLRGDESLYREFAWRHEALFALAWAASIAGPLDMKTPCPDNLVLQFPDLKVAQPAAAFRERLRFRGVDEIMAMADLSLCLHWAIREAGLNGRRAPGSVAPQVIVERRRALEWLLQSGDWDEVELNT